ncbi:unnamed protein product [Gongylonema pulchrum]|uniref:Movement protein n=1 Tax=Gongylonema pulchrum TaxID=637853 RepID=A0A183D644_9BILA|nr:unnamed protein product [Gongylonema pulchrum]
MSGTEWLPPPQNSISGREVHLVYSDYTVSDSEADVEIEEKMEPKAKYGVRLERPSKIKHMNLKLAKALSMNPIKARFIRPVAMGAALQVS